MIILDTTTKKLQIILGGAVAANELPIVVGFADVTTTAFTPGEQNSATTGATAVDICASPAASTQRVVKDINVYNEDSGSVTATVRLNDNATLRILRKVTLAVGDTLKYGDKGWQVIDSNGNEKITGGVVSITGTANEITASAGSGAVVLSLPTALTFAGKTVTGGTLSGVTLSGATILGNITVATPWTITETSERLRLVGGSLLLGTTVATGAAAGSLVLANDAPIQAVIASGASVIGLWKLLSTNGAVIGSGTSASVAVDGILTITDAAKGLFIVGEGSADACAIFVINAGATTELSDPQGIFSNTVGTASSINVYITGGNLTIQNKRAGALTFQYILLKMGSF